MDSFKNHGVGSLHQSTTLVDDHPPFVNTTTEMINRESSADVMRSISVDNKIPKSVPTSFQAPDNVLFRIGPIRVTREDFAIANCKHASANDTILDFFIQFMEMTTPFPKAHVFHTQFFNVLKQAFGSVSSAEKVLFDPAVHRPQHKDDAFRLLFQNPASALHCDIKAKCIFNCDALFIPVCFGEHWFSVMIVDPMDFFIRHSSPDVLERLKQSTVEKKGATLEERRKALANYVFRKPIKKAQEGGSGRSGAPRPIDSRSSADAPLLTTEASRGERSNAEAFLACHPGSHASLTRIFFIDSLLSPKSVNKGGIALQVRKTMRHVLRPIALFLIRRWHAELCSAFGCDSVLQDGDLMTLYVRFFRRDGLQCSVLCVPQQRPSSLDCGFFVLHLIELLRHPVILDAFRERTRMMDEANPENNKKLFRNVVFTPKLSTNNIFDPAQAAQKRQYISNLLCFIDAKLTAASSGNVVSQQCLVSIRNSTDASVVRIATYLQHALA